MQAIRFLHTAFAQALPSVHAGRMKALMLMVHALVTGCDLTLSSLGRATPGSTSHRHAIKRVDRLLGNQHLQRERPLFYATMLRALLANMKNPSILVDWSSINVASDLYVLRAAIPLAGRSFPIFEAVHDREGCPHFQRKFLQTLAILLPEGCAPVFVTDAGFRRPWFQAVEAMGWYYVGRVRNRDLYRTPDGHWAPVKSLYALAGPKPKALGQFEVTRSAPHPVHLYCLHQPAKGRKRLTTRGAVAKAHNSRVIAEREREPWLLASNLPQKTDIEHDVVGIYRQRMQIEEGFRDLKSGRFGFGMELHRTRCPKRIEVLLLISALACYVVFLSGLLARETGAERRFQVGSNKRRQTMSLWRVGLEHLKHCAAAVTRRLLLRMEDKLLAEVQRLGIATM